MRNLIPICVLLIACFLGSKSSAQQLGSEDGGNYTVLVITQSPPTLTDDQLVSWLFTDPRFADLMSRVHFHQFDQRNPIYQQRYAENLPQAPAIALVRPDGGVEYKASGGNIPHTAEALHADMLYYHNLLPYYPPQPQQAWPDTRDYAQSQGYPLRDSSQIAPRYAPESSSGIDPITLLIIATSVFITIAVIGSIAWLLLQED